jgi:transposase
MPVKPFTRGQQWLLPPSLEDMVPQDHMVRFLAVFVDELALDELGLDQFPARRGEPEYDVRLLLSAWLCGFMTRVRSTRRLEQLARENLPMMWLLGGQCPDHSTLARFLRRNGEAIKWLFKKTVHTAVQMGLVEFAFQAVDGTRVGNVSPDRGLTRKQLQALENGIERVMAEMERNATTEEQSRAWEGCAPEMPRDLADAQRLREQVQAALSELDRRAEHRKTQYKGAVDPETGERVGPKVNLADPEAVMMKGRKGYVTGYNAQAAVDAKEQIIVGAELVASATDNDQQVLMLKEIEETAGHLAQVTVMDAGYHSAENLEATQNMPTDLYVADPEMRRGHGEPEAKPFHKDCFEYDPAADVFRCPEGCLLTLEYTVCDTAHSGREIRVYRCHDCARCPYFGVCTNDRHGRRIRIREQDGLLRRHREKMRGEAAKAHMKQRGAVVEPVFGIMKEHLGLSRFLRRGWKYVRAEWHLLCAAHNLRKLCKYYQHGLPARAA